MSRMSQYFSLHDIQEKFPFDDDVVERCAKLTVLVLLFLAIFWQQTNVTAIIRDEMNRFVFSQRKLQF